VLTASLTANKAATVKLHPLVVCDAINEGRRSEVIELWPSKI